MRIDPNAPAYPFVAPTRRASSPGLTIRAEMAKAAMQGILANPKSLEYYHALGGPVGRGIGRDAVLCAMELITALNESEDKP